MKLPNKKPKSRAAICREYGITNPTLLQWENEGINPHDTAAMSERNARKHGGSTSAEMSLAKLTKLQAEARSATLKADTMAGKLIALDEVETAMTRIGNVTKALLVRLQADLPPMLEGQTASRMAIIISESVTAILTQMSDPEGMAWRR